MNKKDKIYIAGSNGMVGSGIIRKLQQEGFTNLIFHTSKDLDLRNQLAVKTFFENEKPDYVILAAAKVGGIFANNKYRAEFIYDNLMIESNVIHFSYVNNVKKLLFLGSSCIYPKFASQPLKEEYLLSGFLEFTNQPYAIAKIAGIEMCDSYRDQYGCNFISAMPTNLYGTNDNYHPMNSHVLPALIRKIILAKKNKEQTVTIWGTGKPFREFLHVDDLADACLFLINNFNDKGPINVGFGEEISIENLAIMIAKIVDYHGDLIYDTSKPDGTPRKIMDITKIKNLGWSPKTMLYDGVSKTINEAKKLILENDY
jgi:GDP-L-fucose synthase